MMMMSNCCCGLKAKESKYFLCQLCSFVHYLCSERKSLFLDNRSQRNLYNLHERNNRKLKREKERRFINQPFDHHV